MITFANNYFGCHWLVVSRTCFNSIVLKMSISIKPLWIDLIRRSSDSRGSHALLSLIIISKFNHDHRPGSFMPCFFGGVISIPHFFQKFFFPWSPLVWETPVALLLLLSLKTFLIWCIFTMTEDIVANKIYFLIKLSLNKQNINILFWSKRGRKIQQRDLVRLVSQPLPIMGCCFTPNLQGYPTLI